MRNLAYNLVNTAVSSVTALLSIQREAKKIVAFDIETTGLDPFNDSIVLVQFYTPGERPVIIDTRNMSMVELGNILRPILEDTSFLKIGHNLTFDYMFVRAKTGVGIKRLFDTMLAERLLTAGLFEDASLGPVAKKYTGTELDKTIGEEFTKLDLTLPIPSYMLDYAVNDVLVLPGIMAKQVAELIRNGMIDVAKLEFEAMPYLIGASLHGVLIDPVKWREHVVHLTEEAERYSAELITTLQPYVDTWRVDKFGQDSELYESRLAQWSVLKGARDAEEAALEEMWTAQYQPMQDEYEEALAEWKGRKVAFRKSMNGKKFSREKIHEYMNEWLSDNPEPVDPGVKAKVRAIMSAWRKDNPSPVKPPKPVCGSGVIDLSSYQQLSGALQAADVPLPHKDNGNGLETGRKYLELIADDEPVVRTLLNWRALEKLVVAFGENIMALLGKDNRLHPEFNQLVSTGRMSCRKPNVQQVPANLLGSKFRECFIAPPGYVLIAVDYSNIELRVLAEITMESALLEAFDAGRDLHSETAARMFGLKYEEVKEKYPDKRKAAKTIMFGLIYGQGPSGLAMSLKIQRRQAKDYIEAFFHAHPRVDAWLKKTGRDGLLNHYSTTILGRRRFFPKIVTDDYKEKERLEAAYKRMLCNHPIQGTSADITKQAVINIGKALEESGYDAHMVMFVHDEIVVECVAEQAEVVTTMIEDQMKAAAQRFLHRVKVEVGTQVSDHWVH